MFSHELIVTLEVLKKRHTALQGRAAEVLIIAERSGTEGDLLAQVQELQRDARLVSDALAEFTRYANS